VRFVNPNNKFNIPSCVGDLIRTLVFSDLHDALFSGPSDCILVATGFLHGNGSQYHGRH